jgi:hypothetical protein
MREVCQTRAAARKCPHLCESFTQMLRHALRTSAAGWRRPTAHAGAPGTTPSFVRASTGSPFWNDEVRQACSTSLACLPHAPRDA